MIAAVPCRVQIYPTKLVQRNGLRDDYSWGRTKPNSLAFQLNITAHSSADNSSADNGIHASVPCKRAALDKLISNHAIDHRILNFERRKVY